MSAWMLNGDKHVAGSLTSGGTESVLMAVKTYRDRALHARPHLKNLNMIASQTVHPAFEKAAHYFGVEIIHVRTTEDLRMDVKEVERVINSNTILIVGSAPQYCHGVIDPITKLAKIAEDRGAFTFCIIYDLQIE
jgi:sphinganine-1-phosphate aldolase